MNSEQASTDQTVPPIHQAALPRSNQSAEPAPSPVQVEQVVIWTPRFIIVFALTLVLGLSLQSAYTQAWSINWLSGMWIFLVYIIALGICWIALLDVSRSRWIRFGAVFGLICTAFITINIVIQFILIEPSEQILAHVNVAACLALLGCSICLSIARIPTGRWDAWFLGLTPVIGVAPVASLYFLASARSLYVLENTIATVALLLSVLVWWIRPSCWKNAPAPTLLFGAASLILLLLDTVYVGSHTFNLFPVYVTQHAAASLANRETDFFFSLVTLLCLLLGVMRLAQYEKEGVVRPPSINSLACWP
ncbi:MAG: hypothetical protein NVS3B14_18160 [Ktedonobacteraceae bacterium]